MYVTFTDKDHLYFYGKERLQSVSSYVGKFKPKFEQDLISKRSVIKSIIGPAEYRKESAAFKYCDKETVEYLINKLSLQDIIEEKAKEVRDSWMAKTQKGTDLHNKKELKYLDQGYKICPFDGKKYTIPQIVYDKYEDETCDNRCPVENLGDLVPGYYPELVVFDLEEMVAGQIDEAYIKETSSGLVVSIDDYKTDNSILKKGYFDKCKNEYPKFKFPIDHLHNSNLNYYGLKISKYAYMLESSGFIIDTLCFTHYNLKDLRKKPKRYYVPYMREEIKLMKKFASMENI